MVRSELWNLLNLGCDNILRGKLESRWHLLLVNLENLMKEYMLSKQQGREFDKKYHNSKMMDSL